jgi:hypothetical protein
MHRAPNSVLGAFPIGANPVSRSLADGDAYGYGYGNGNDEFGREVIEDITPMCRL